MTKRRKTQKSLPLNVRMGNPIRPSVALRSVYEKELGKLLQPMLRSLRELVENLQSLEESVPLESGQHLATDAAKKKKPKWGSWREYIASGVWMDEEKYKKQFDEKSMKTATWFAKRTAKNVDKQWDDNAETLGFPEFRAKYSTAVWNVMQGTIEENVDLIKSIPEKHFALVRTAVETNLRKGGNLQSLTKRLRNIQSITERRAALIARDQLNKATQSIVREREQEHGITEGIWVHSLVRKHPRKSHLEAGRKGIRFDLNKGAWLKDDNTGEYRYQLPGQEINCGCTHRAVIVIGGEEF